MPIGECEVGIETLPADEILALSNLLMSETQQTDLNDLLAAQREGALGERERVQLAALMDTYRRGLVRKAQALQIVVERGLRPSLT